MDVNGRGTQGFSTGPDSSGRGWRPPRSSGRKDSSAGAGTSLEDGEDVDADLKAFLEAMEQRLQAQIGAVDTRIAGLETRIETVDTRIERLGKRIAEAETTLGARIDAQGRELRQAIADLATRMDAGFAARKQDEDLALREIRTLKGRMTNLERRVKRLESAKQ
jgi:chromosome segregation ATPase